MSRGWPTRRARRSRGEGGQGIAEFALVLPVFLMMVFGIIDIGRTIWAFDNLANAAREGARYASVHGNSQVTTCKTGPNLPASDYTSGCPAWTTDSKSPTRAATRSFLVAPGSAVTVYVCYYASTPCSNNADQTGATNGRGAYVTVTVTSTINLVTPALLGFTGFTVTGQSTMLVNN